jgi:hypothetical protein
VGVSVLPSDELLELRLPVLETLLGEEDDDKTPSGGVDDRLLVRELGEGVTSPRFIRPRGVDGADNVVMGKISTSSS